ncbi:MAG: hypothetical protein H7835_19915, partial [Magnetococcus sp. XQGC-1]
MANGHTNSTGSETVLGLGNAFVKDLQICILNISRPASAAIAEYNQIIGAYTLNGSVPGFNAFSAGIGVGNTCYYCAELGAAWEVGVGTISTSPGTISRDRILSSSNSGSAVVWPAGSTVNVFCVAPAEIATLMVSGRSITTTGELKSAIGVARWYPPINLF